MRWIVLALLAIWAGSAQAAPPEPQVSDRNLAGVLTMARSIAGDADRLAPGDVPAAQTVFSNLESVIRQFGTVTTATEAEVLAVAQYLMALRDQIIATANAPSSPAAADGMSETDAIAFIRAMEEKYDGPFALPNPTDLLRDGNLTIAEAEGLIAAVARFQNELAADLPTMAAIAPNYRSANRIFAKMDGGALADFTSAFDNFSRVLDGIVSSGVSDAARRAALDPASDAERIRGSAAQAADRDAATIATLEAAAMLEPAFDLPPKYTERLAALRQDIAAYEALVARVGATPDPELPPDIGDANLTAIAGEVLAKPRYGIGEIRRLVVNAPTKPRRRIDTRIFNNTLETVVREWTEFQATTVEDVAGTPTLHFNTIAKFSRGDATTPIGEWVLHKRLVGRAIPASEVQ